MSKADIKKKYKKIVSIIQNDPNKDDQEKNICNIWKNSDGKVFPGLDLSKTNNSSSPGSYNVLISNACFLEKNIIREKNEYDVLKQLQSNTRSTIENNTTPKDTSPVAKGSTILESNVQSMISKIDQKNEKILDDEKMPAMHKIKTILGIDINDRRTNHDFESLYRIWNPPYYSRRDIYEFINNTDDNEEDMFYSPADKILLNKNKPLNNKHFFKIILYAIIYKIPFNRTFLKSNLIKKFRKTAKQAFKDINIENTPYDNLERQLQRSFSFLYYFDNFNTVTYVNGKAVNKYLDEFYDKSYNDVQKYFLDFYINLHPNVKKRNMRQLIYNFDYSIKKDDNYESLSNSNDRIDDPALLEFKKQKYPCKYQYDFLEKDENMKTFAKDMIKSCNLYQRKSIITKDTYDTLIDFKNTIKRNAINTIVDEDTANDNFGFLLEMDIRYPLKSLFDIYLEKYPEVNILTVPLKYIIIKKKSYDGIDFIAQDVGGVRNDFFNDIANELFEKKVFVKPNVNILKTNRYFLNPQFDIKDLSAEYKRYNLESGKKSSSKSPKTSKSPKSPSLPQSSPKSSSNIFIDEEYDEEKTNRFYTFLGELIIFLWINNFRLPHKLSSFLLSGFITKHYKKETIEYIPMTKYSDMIYFMMRDFYNAYDLLIYQPLKLGYDIKSSINMDTFTSLTNNNVFEDKEITRENYIEYLTNLSIYIYTLNAIQDDNTLMEGYHASFFDAFNNRILKIIKAVNTLQINLGTIEDDLTKSKITNQNIKDFVDKIEIVYTGNLTHKAYGNSIKQNFYNFLMEDNNRMSKLLKFWSGIDDYNEDDVDKSYILNIYSNNTLQNPDPDSLPLPVSHTCFNTIDIPRYKDFNEFFKKLDISINNTYNADMAGGKINHKKIK